MSSAWEDASTSGFDGSHILRPVDVDDDESNLKDNWDDEDEPAPVAAPPKPTAKPKPKKKAEKEPIVILTAEQQAQLKIDAEKRVREVDLELAKEMLGAKINVSDVSFTPTSAEQFDHLNNFLVGLISSLTSSTYFPDFAEKFTRDLAVSLDTDILKKMSDVLSAVLTEKNKIKQQEKKSKKSGKGIKLRVGDPMRETGEEDLFGGADEEADDTYAAVEDKYDFM